MTTRETTARHATRREACHANYPLAALLSIFIFFAYVAIMTFSPLAEVEDGILGWLNKSNMPKYFAGLALLAAALFGLMVLSRYLPHAGKRLYSETSDRVRYGVFFGIVLAAATYLFIYVFYTEQSGTVFGETPETLPWHLMPVPLAVTVAAGFAFFCLYTLLRGRDVGRVATLLLYLGALVLTYYGIVHYDLRDIHHGTAYIESIFNAYHGAPYDLVSTGIYGHYGIFFAPLLRIFGGTPQNLFALIALSGVLATLAVIYVAERLISKNLLRVLAVYGGILTITAMRVNNYWQLQPHRILFPLLTLAYLTSMVKREAFGTRRVIGGFGLVAAAIVWNTETGLFCAVAYVAALILHEWQVKCLCDKKTWLKCIALLAGIPASLVGAIVFVNLYNLVCGGELILKTFFFPIFESSYMDGTLKADLPAGIQVWPLVFLLFLLMLVIALYHTKLTHREGLCPHAPVYLALSMMAMMNCSYYVNRAAYYNLDICVQLAALGMALLADRYLPELKTVFSEKKSVLRSAAAALCLCLVTVLAVLSVHVGYAAVPMAQRVGEGGYDPDFFADRAAQLAEIVPEDYMLVGTGACVFQMQLGREPVHCYRDISDLYVGGDTVEQQIVRDARAHGRVAFYLSTTVDQALHEAFLASGECRLVATGMIGEVLVACYECE